jgi:hypothetical protein
VRQELSQFSITKALVGPILHACPVEALLMLGQENVAHRLPGLMLLAMTATAQPPSALL